MSGAVTESLTTSPTVSVDNVVREPGITPGGLDPADNVPTLGKMQSGQLVAKWVCLIEGVEYVLTDCPSTAAVQLAHKGTDWASSVVLPGLFVHMRNSQSIAPDEPFVSGGRCQIRVVDTDGADTFGVYVNRRDAGSETTISSTADRNDTTLNVKSTSDFPSSGTVYVGTERVDYTGTSATSFTGCTRGMFSPFGGGPGGSAGSRYGHHHRVSTSDRHTQSRPVVSETPRVWIGKRVGVWLHTWNESTQALNTHDNAQLVFAGRIVGISDDPDTFHTVLECEHSAAEFKEAVIARDIYSAELVDGIELIAGRKFTYKDTIFSTTSTVKTANALNVVTSGATGANQINAGYYTLESLCSALNRWLASEKAAGRIYAYISIASPVSSNVGLRTKAYWRIEAGSNIFCKFLLEMPGEIALFLGIKDDSALAGQSSAWVSKTADTNTDQLDQSEFAPYRVFVFAGSGPGRIGQEFSLSAGYETTNERGTFQDQYATLPASVKGSCDKTQEWGLFLLDDRVLIVGTYAAGVLKNSWIAPFQLVADNNASATKYIGRRVDEPAAPLTLRQVFMFEGTFAQLFAMMLYSSGITGYNHGTSDTLGAGLGLGMPGALFAEDFDRSLYNLPGAEAPVAVVIDEPIKFADLFRDDLRIRRAFLRWKNERYELCQWKTPLVANSIALLEDSNKAAPAGTQDNHRSVSEETDEWQYPVIKIDYSRDFGSSRSTTYLRSVSVMDAAALDDMGGTGRTLTLKLRNTFHQFANTGAAVESLLPGYMATMPMFSRPARKIARSIDLRSFETIAPGDIVTVTDSFARDPLTGLRGINARAATVTRLSYDLGGPAANGGLRQMVGEVELFFLDTQRGGQFAPCANIDHEANFGGFSAGYNATTSTLRCRPHDYSDSYTIEWRGRTITVAEPLDADNFLSGYVCTIVERDPADPSSPITWVRTVSSVSGNDITFTSGLSSPAWDGTKRYRIFFDNYADCTIAQRDYAFQADDADEMIENIEIPYQFSSEVEPYDYGGENANDLAELVPTLAYGDGKPWDVGIDRALANTINKFIDYKSAHQQPFLWSEDEKAFSGLDTDYAGEESPSATMYAGLYYLGLDHLSTAVSRFISLSTFNRDNALVDGTGAVRVSVSRTMPQLDPSTLPDGAAGQYGDPLLAGDFDESAVYNLTGTTYATSAEVALSANVKDLQFGFVWVIVEMFGGGQSLGIDKMIEGPRVVSE